MAPQAQELRRGARDRPRRSIGLPGSSWPSAACCRASPTRAAGGPPSRPTRRRSTRWCGRSSAPAYVPGEEVAISLDIAASEFGRDGRYTLGLEGARTRQRRLGRAAARLVRALSDPVDRGSPRGRRSRRPRALHRGGRRPRPGHRRRFLVTNAALVEAAARRHRQRGAGQGQPGRNGDRGRGGLAAGKRAGFGTIVSARSGETEDVAIAHLAVGWGAGQLKVGSFARSERMAKWNEVLRIEEALGARARFAGTSGCRRPLLAPARIGAPPAGTDAVPEGACAQRARRISARARPQRGRVYEKLESPRLPLIFSHCDVMVTAGKELITLSLR